MPSTTTQGTKESYTQGCMGTVFPFDQVNEPGCYIFNWNGHLLRVPQDGIQPGRSPLMSMIGHDPILVTKISDNPYLPLTKARLMAADCDVNVNF